MTIRASEFDALAAKVDVGELTEDEVVRWMTTDGWPGHSVLECWAWWEKEYAHRGGPALGGGATGNESRAGDEGRNP